MNLSGEKQQIIVSPQYELFVLGMVILQLVNSILLFTLGDTLEREIIWPIYWLTAVFLIIDVIIKFIRAKAPLNFIIRRGGWMLVVGSLPIPGFTALRLIYSALVIRAIRRSELIEIELVLAGDRARSTFLGVIFLSLLILEFASMGVLAFESTSPSANIKTGSDAIWWSVVTMATVGYGDRYPVTNQGRMVAVITMFIGVGVFSVLTSFLANWFRTPRPARLEKALINPITDLDAEIASLYLLLEAQEKANAESLQELRQQIKRIEDARRSGLGG
jgi:voltage-gated potassium channel Kch